MITLDTLRRLCDAWYERIERVAEEDQARYTGVAAITGSGGTYPVRIRLHPDDYAAYPDVIGPATTLVRFAAPGEIQPGPPPPPNYAFNGLPLVADASVPIGAPVIE